MKKEKTNEPMNAKGIIIDGVECVTLKQAMQMAGVSYPTFVKKVELFKIEKIRRSNRSLFRRQDIETAIENNWFAKWWV